MKILGIETSCDDTSVALVDCNDQGFFVLSEKTASQVEVHKKYGGVVPEVAGREHAENIFPVIEQVTQGHDKPDAIAVTAGPGLITGLLVGIEAAKILSYLWSVPLLDINHIEGHIHSVLIQRDEQQNKKIQFPAVCLTVSGGHTMIILVKNFGHYVTLGQSKDDAAGEALDKVGKLIGLEYPGGPKISRLAEKGNPEAMDFPRPMIGENNFDFSFSGLKTAALYWLKDNARKQNDHYMLPEKTKADFCASFEAALVEVLVFKTMKAAQKHEPRGLILAGGVSANRLLRRVMQKTADSINCPLLMAESGYSMDNAAMIAAAGYTHAKNSRYISWKNIKADPDWRL